MDELVKRSIREVDAKKKATVPWKLDEPWKQSYHVFSVDRNNWVAIDPTTQSTTHTSPDASITRLALYSWNIDFMLPFPNSRMRTAIRHLEEAHVAMLDAQTASVIYLQECVASDLQLLASDPWVRSTFALTDLDITNWQSGHYGTVTLVDRRLAIADCFRVHYSQSAMERDAFFVDIRLGKNQDIVRLCNSHLESLALEPAYRPPQMQLIAKYMRDTSVHGALAAGDFNAIQDFDRHLHSDNGLKDAYLELGGREEDAEAGHTWGQQAATVLRERFGTTRMDKVYFCGGVRCLGFERFGAGEEIPDESERRQIVELGFDRPWVTDHLGVKAVFEVAPRANL
ncbi:Endonuclease/exonuclease/phosphatase [Neohortaea acidophila]|uniref:Endonuclease/exonuclease/phosphatase n=1 Tax=Neohortaea acidophila TaxID=245834 RepID=A0A6A6PWS6_9PEZI|nr:Endonuclease/exonuclease/phosphatase [Neohortaea acidophila]KAF2484139.1 Endonuclease/exonuclease/phosphatase [Neohortaea acidophila]